MPLSTSAPQALGFTLTRQSLTRWRAASSAEAVVALVERVGPLTAVEAWAPTVAILARLDGFAPEHLFAAWRDELTKRPAMRGQVHLLPRRRAAAAAVASPARDDLTTELDARGIGSGARHDLARAAHEVLLRRGTSPAQDLHAALAADTAVEVPDPETFRDLVLPWLWLRGSIERGVAGPDWRRDPLDVCPPPDAPIELPPAGDADAAVARWFVEAFGPAADHDLAGWAGWRVDRARAALSELAPELVEVDVEGIGEGLVLLDSDAERLERTEDGPSGSTVLLPPDDGLLHAYNRTWGRLADEAAWRRVKRPHGHRAPAVLVDGRIAGTWTWDPEGVEPLRVELWDGHADTRVRAEAQRVAVTLGAPAPELTITGP